MSIITRRKVEIANDKYTEIKKDILENKLIKRADVPLSRMEIADLKTIRVDGQVLALTNDAINGLVYSLGISKRFVDVLKVAYDNNQEILNEILRAIKSKKTKVLTLVYNTKFQEVTNIYPSDKKLISDPQYFEVLEQILAKTPGTYLRNIVQNSNGDIKAVIANPLLEFKFAGMDNETFTSGMTLDLSAMQLQSSFFTERLICSNGMTTQNKLCSRSVNVSGKIPDFINDILGAEYNIQSIDEFKKRLNRCYHTIASLAEVLRTEYSLKSILGNYADSLTDQCSFNRIRMAFGEQYLAERNIHSFLKTDITLWQLVNEITAVSSRIEQHRIPVPENVNLKIQIIGGNLMFTEPDLTPSNIKQVFK
jgi:hypothetical protein